MVCSRGGFVRIALLFVIGSCRVWCQATPQLSQLTPAQIGQRVEFRVDNLPASTNPFDPETVRVDATFGSPSGRTNVVPAFWFQSYQRSLVNGSESLGTAGPPGWRLRFLPGEAGGYSLQVRVQTNGQTFAIFGTNFLVAPQSLPGFGYVRVAPGNQYLQTDDGRPLPLVGENVGWPGARGTYDYDSWFSSMQQAGENYARVWMCPWWLGLETDPGSLNRYRLDRAWQLDYVLQSAEQHGIYLLLCLDFHGMFETVPDYWVETTTGPPIPITQPMGGHV